MRSKIQNAIGSTISDIIKNGGKTSFTERELKSLNVDIPEVKLDADDIKKIRNQIHLSQAVFAKLLNVSISSIRQWEQGVKKPSGSTQVLLELLYKKPDVLNYRIMNNK